MKQISLVFALVLLSCGMPYLSRAQFFGASAPEFFSPFVANVADNPFRTNCHSAGGFVDIGTLDAYDVAINTFEGYTVLFPFTPVSGFSWYLRNVTTPGITTSFTTAMPPTINEMRNMDIGLLQSPSGEILVLVSFMDFTPTTGGQFIALYELDMAGNNATYVGGSLTQLTTNTTTVSQVNLDVNGFKYFVVTFEDGLRTYTKSGVVAGGTAVTLGNTNELLLGTPTNRPDVALCNSGSGLNVHYVYRLWSGGGVQESTIDWNTVQTQPAATPINVTVEDNYSPSAYDYPRIDCPDFASLDQWSYVLMQNNHEIGAAVSDGTGPIYHHVLNNATIAAPTPIDLTAYKNIYPVVAYDADNSLIHYSWAVAANPSWAPYGFTNNQGYVGVMMQNGTNLVDSRYWLMENNLDMDIVTSQSLALSGENNSSPELLTTWTFTDASNGDDFIKAKVIPWSSTGFKPTGVQKLDKNVANVQVYPNPTRSSFGLKVAQGVDLGKCQLSVTDISGRKIMVASDDFTTINQLLLSGSKKLHAGMYTVHLQSERLEDGVSFVVVKQ